MTSAQIAKLELLIDGPRDGALLRYALGNEWLKAGRPDIAKDYLRDTVRLDGQYSAAWKQLGRALAETGDIDGALAAYAEGIRIAETKGDLQAAKEMTVFAKRLRKSQGDDDAASP